MTNDTLVLVVGFASSTIASLFAAWRGEQNIRTIALRVKEETLEVALELAKETKHTNDKLTAKVDHNTELTIIGNNIKADILSNQQQTKQHAVEIEAIRRKTLSKELDQSDQLDRMEVQDKDTNAIVHKISNKQIDKISLLETLRDKESGGEKGDLS